MAGALQQHVRRKQQPHYGHGHKRARRSTRRGTLLGQRTTAQVHKSTPHTPTDAVHLSHSPAWRPCKQEHFMSPDTPPARLLRSGHNQLQRSSDTVTSMVNACSTKTYDDALI